MDNLETSTQLNLIKEAISNTCSFYYKDLLEFEQQLALELFRIFNRDVDYILDKNKYNFNLNVEGINIEIPGYKISIYNPREDSFLDYQSLNESINLNEATKNQMIIKSKSADSYSSKNQTKGKNRYERRIYSQMSSNRNQYNKIDMDALFKRDILTIGILVHGETDDYTVTMRFTGICKNIRDELSRKQKDKVNFKIISRALTKAFNNGQIQMNCTCKDAQYRQRYWQWRNGNGTQYEPRPSNITNPKDTKGAGCKHTLLVLSNLDWLMKITSVINNYIEYARTNKQMQRLYADYIFPKIYGTPYKKAVQLSIFDTGMLPNDQKTIKTSMDRYKGLRDEKGRFVSKNKNQPTQQTKNVKTSPTLFTFNNSIK